VSREKLVEDCLGLEDEIQKSFEARLDGNYGIIFMSKRRLIFITEKGRFRKRYDLVLDKDICTLIRSRFLEERLKKGSPIF